MLGWRKRNDGFEWREYVRTTILVRRKQRRDRIGEAGRAAVDNLKAAGQRGAAAGAEGARAVGRGAAQVGQQGAVLGAAGAKAMGRGAVNLGQQGAVLGAEGAKAAGRGAVRYGREAVRLGAIGARAGMARARAAAPVAGNYLQRFGAWLLYAAAYVWAVLRTIGGIVADHLAPLLAPLASFLRRPGVRLAVLAVGAVALAGGIIRAQANGFVTDTWIVLVTGIVLLAALALAHVSAGVPQWASGPLHAAGTRSRELFGDHANRPGVQKGLAAAVLALAVAGGLYAWHSTSGSERMTATRRAQVEPQAAVSGNADISGMGHAVTGDTLRVGSTTVHLDGIEAPLPDQSCLAANGRPWPCGEAARQALARMLRSRRIECNVADRGEPRTLGECRINGRDIAAELVSQGHVFASPGLFAAYTGFERDARGRKAGIWVGEALRPADYRAQRWEEAKRASPDGCPIKGNVRGGRRFYLVPWARGYERVRITQSRGERWFCSEDEAKEAGFRPAEQS